MVCGEHFKDDYFKPPSKMFYNSQYFLSFNATYYGYSIVGKGKGKIKRLKKSAMPSLHLPKSVLYKSPPKI